ncbi:MAG: DMT family transporter [Bdellovibrionaceae bacterium]|nr:DMT family transporter [Pseudobdellovibrionaceae bacterium]
MILNRATRYILVATLLFTALNICVKYLPHIPASELVFFRGLVTLFISAFYVLQKKLPIMGNNRPILVLRGFFGTMSLFALFYCLQHIPLAMATVISNLAPLFTVLIAHYFLKEKATWMNWILLAVAFLGVLLIKGWDPNVSWHYALIGIAGAFSAACAYTCVRMLRTTEHAMVVILHFQVMCLPLMIVPMLLHWVEPSLKDWAVIVLLGVLTQFAQYYMTISYQLEAASKIMVYNYAGVIWSLIVGAWLFNELFAGAQILGVVIIFASIAVSSFYERRVRDKVEKKSIKL